MAATDEVLINKEVEVSNSSVGVREGAGSSSRLIGYLEPGKVYNATLQRNGYMYIPALDGWVLSNYVTVVRDTSPTVSQESTAESQEIGFVLDQNTKETIQTYLTEEERKTIYEQYVNTEYGDVMDDKGAADNLLISDLNGVWGIPYQFPSSVDPPIQLEDDEYDNKDKKKSNDNRTGFGYFYADRIINRMPLLMISPGKVNYMQGYKNGAKTAILETLASVAGGDSNASVIGDFLNKPGKYYTFEYDEANYWEYVNAMNRACAIYLGIDDVRVSLNGYSAILRNFRWEKCSNDKFDTILSSDKQYVCFYADADTTKQETFGNSTQRSQLADQINSMSDIAKEIQFLLGANTGITLPWMQDGAIEQINQKIGDICNGNLNGIQIVQDIGKEFATIATGGKLIFPEIWSDSEFSQSLDVKIKLRCPCPNKVSWFLDILAPINMLIALTMPRTPYGKNSTGRDSTEPMANGYYCPFLVRAFYKGLFNCDMGIITDLSITKGKEGSWTLDGLPSEVDIDLTIKDLYNVMAMTSDQQPTEFLNNTTFLNYLANACGISINKPDIERSIDMWLMIHTNNWKDRLTGYSFWQHASQGIKNKLYNIYSGYFKG